ncbi:hypothetical protein [Clostridium beijerinckii]|uniref:hypothetical protein n=1 Tax=Clostridium beijerinckii TaxID=1520 RepID=UPI00098C74F1|nr:hypothetical protein [Clostridium beijerinckii]NRY62639.1 hypothetical protein [Clostridium beijerinckii]
MKITIVCTPISSYGNTLSRINVAPVATNGTYISSTTIYNKSGGGSQTTLTYTLTLDIINTAKSQGKNIGEIFIQHTNG